MSPLALEMLPAVLAQSAAGSGASGDSAFGTKEMVFLGLWVLFSVLYWNNYRKTENLPLSFLKVGGLLGFVYAVISGFDWLQAVVPAEEVITFWGLFSVPDLPAARVPFMGKAFTWFVVGLLLMVVWHARRKFSTVFGVILSAWDRGHWYMLPVIFILMTVGLLLVAAAASPVLSPFIYTLF
jgi:hypothetical protein